MRGFSAFLCSLFLVLLGISRGVGMSTCPDNMDGYFKCPSSGSCIPEEWLCDDHSDCDRNEDENEENCRDKLNDADYCDTNKYFECDDGTCIDYSLHCNDFRDCADNSDEMDCEDSPFHLDLENCLESEFACHSEPGCIEMDFVCDNWPDCDNGRDEQDCPTKCAEDEFYCVQGDHCLPMKYVCNNVTDCDGGADEQNCQDRHDPCQGIPKGYPCDNRKECVQSYFVCDGMPHCSDSSDEKYNCSKRCNHQCHQCYPSPTGVECHCREGFRLANIAGKDVCQAIECDQLIDRQPYCSQICSRSMNIECSCEPGYKLNTDGRTCSAEGSEPVLVYATLEGIRKFSLHSHVYDVVIDREPGIKAIALDSKKKVVFWSEGGERPAVLYMDLDQQDKPHSILMAYGLKEPHGLAYDYIRRNLYVADTGMPSILACKIAITCVTVFDSSTLAHPTELVINMRDSLLYWFDHKDDRSVIMSGSMDGRTSQVFVDNVRSADSLVFDGLTGTLIWGDRHRGVVESIRADGTDRKVVIAHSDVSPDSLAVFEDRLFWASEEHEYILGVNKFTGLDDVPLMHVPVVTALGILHESVDFYKEAIDPCYGKCLHMCLKGQGQTHSCMCQPGDKPSQSGLYCERSLAPEDFPSSLLVSSGPTILSMMLTPIGSVKAQPVNTTSMSSVFCLAYLPTSRDVIYSDQSQQGTSINRLTTTEHLSLVSTPILTRLEAVESLAVDESSGLVYWVNADKKIVEVASLSGSHRTVLSIEHITQPNALALDLESRLLYISDVSSLTTILECHQDGTDCMALVQDQLNWPNCLVVSHGRLYWSDYQSRRISSIGLDGQQRRTVAHTESNPLFFAIVRHEVFWIEQDKNYILYQDIYDMDKPRRLDLKRSGLSEIVATSAKVVPSPCSSMNGGCDHLCLPKLDTLVCLCDQGFVLQNDGKTCEKRDAPAIPHCDGFMCSNGITCLPLSSHCDDIKDCPSGNDEQDCPVKERTCWEDQFQCPDGECYSNQWHCDGHNDCSDGSDESEENCRPVPCEKGEFFCDKKCRHVQICDGFPDCDDGTDEQNCPPPECQPDEHFCDDDVCVHKSWVCDGDPECQDGSDEMNCGDCKPGEFLCMHECIDVIKRCDGTMDCNSGEDELNCPTEPKCPRNYFPCDLDRIPSSCVHNSSRCNGSLECRNGLDEISCYNKKTPCSPTDFQCTNGPCIGADAVCDGKSDCSDGSDERAGCEVTCESLGCSFHCERLSGVLQCVCPSGFKLVEDTNCEDINECNEWNGGCSQMCQNKRGGFQCQCILGYDLLSDERSCVATEGQRSVQIVTTPTDLYQISNQGTHKLAPLTNPALEQHIDLNIHTREMFWLEKEKGFTNVRKRSGNETTTLIKGAGSVGGMAVDWITGNLFLTIGRTIVVFDKAGQEGAVLHHHPELLGEIVAYPARGQIFWIGKGHKPCLMSGWMNGHHVQTLHTFNTAAFTLALSLDPATERLFVKRRPFGEIFSVKIDGSQRRLQLQADLTPMGSIDVFESTAYMTSQVMDLAVAVKTYVNHAEEEKIVRSMQKIQEPTAIKVVHKLKQPASKNRCEKKACMYLCVHLPSGGATCLCPNHIKMKLNPKCEGLPPKKPVNVNSHNTSATATCSPPCLNGGRCVLSGMLPVCSCPAGFSLPSCTKAQGSEEKKKEGLTTGAIVGLIIGLIALGLAIAAAVYMIKQRRNNQDLMQTIKYKNANPKMKRKSHDKTDLVPEISFGNPGFQENEMDAEMVGQEKDWWKRLLTRSRSSMDSSYVSKSSSECDPPCLQKDPNDNYFESCDEAHLLK